MGCDGEKMDDHRGVMGKGYSKGCKASTHPGPNKPSEAQMLQKFLHAVPCGGMWRGSTTLMNTLCKQDQAMA